MLSDISSKSPTEFNVQHSEAIASSVKMNFANSTSAVSRTLYGATRGHSRSTSHSKYTENGRVVNGLISGIHQSSVRRAVTSMQMPAMSPTMTEGGIAQWKKQEGESFSAGDVLLEVVSCCCGSLSSNCLLNNAKRKRTRLQSTWKRRRTG